MSLTAQQAGYENSAIVDVAYHLPDGVLTNAELVERFGAEMVDKIANSAGILNRRIAAEGECASDLAYAAAQKLFARGACKPEDIDALIFATQTPDYLLPTTACILQDRLGLRKDIMAFDINLGCSQYVYAVSVAHSLVKSGLAQHVLVLTGDTVSKIINPLDRAVVPLFGDAGTATLVAPTAAEAGFQYFDFGTDGSGAEYLIWPTSGLRVPKTAESAALHTDKMGSTRSQNDMYMDGKSIFIFTLKHVPQTVKAILQKASLLIDDIDLFIFHQASELIVSTAAKKLKIPEDKCHMMLADIGNSGGSTVGVALSDAIDRGKIKPGMRVMLTAFGVGLSWGSTLIQWPAR